jgi:hypothetical protein
MTAKSNTNGESDGKIRIIGARGKEEKSYEFLNGEITIDLVTEKGPKIAAEPSSGESAQVLLDETLTDKTTPESKPEEENLEIDDRKAKHAWLLVVPALNFLVAVAIAIFTGPEIWSTQSSVLGEWVVRLGQFWLFAISLAGTLWMWNDGAALREYDSPWQPNETVYIASGAIVLALFGSGFYLLQGFTLSETLPAFGGMFFLGLPTSSIVSGPVYLYNRSRTIGFGDQQSTE